MHAPSRASNAASFENGILSKTVMISQDIEPPPLAAIAPGKLSPW
jgi:hypothetical protein